MPSEVQRVLDAANRIADAIGKRDVGALGRELAPGFLLRTPAGEARGAAAFLDAIGQIQGEMVFVKLVGLTVDLSGESAVATGVQHARVRVEGQTIDDRRPFVDWFVKHDGEWRLRLAVDLPAAAGEPAAAQTA
jgi:hypothetical protein